MPNSGPRDGFFDPTLTLMINSYKNGLISKTGSLTVVAVLFVNLEFFFLLNVFLQRNYMYRDMNSSSSIGMPLKRINGFK